MKTKQLQRIYEHLHAARLEVSAAIACVENDSDYRSELKDEVEDPLFEKLSELVDQLESRGIAA